MNSFPSQLPFEEEKLINLTRMVNPNDRSAHVFKPVTYSKKIEIEKLCVKRLRL